MKKKNIIIGSSVILCLLVLLGAVYIIKKHQNNTAEAKAQKYSIYHVTKTADLALSGSVQAQKSQLLTNPDGKVQTVLVKNGDTVTEGQQLLTTHDTDEQETVTTLQEQVNKARRTVLQAQQEANSSKSQLGKLSATDDGYSDLQKQQTEAQNALADAQADQTEVQNKLQRANAKVDNTLTAPYAGTVQLDYSKTGEAEITLISNDLNISGEISEYDYDKVKVGQNVDVTATATGQKTNATISYLAKVPAADSKPNNAKYQFEAPLNAKFLDGQTVKIAVPTSQVRLPKESVRKGQIYLVNNKHVTKRNISGHVQNGYYLVKSGVTAGQKIIANPDSALKQGERIAADD
ncbi:efflux RND transporter periplasmic adaptor subunit [Liquorilactobacillus capillatus]|uniref:Periplasmic component of efflux system n=1 Tax=Liquorilactobacillus capillatus DSM 19910 TaxID=1423731 RepID=A0A0R1M3T1_9LACO|nr:HlyD family efflux transporter periplasmic adaptor subunit [Liquorilactobacillus capillatus]KRL02409.1 periplasmic component of efflux system [Liquorilactobacillus capillatus DSM 19910]